MKMSKGKKKFLIACVAVLVAGLTVAVTLMNDVADVVATQKVFDGMKTNYSATANGQVNILEIVPTDERYTGNRDNVTYDISSKSELGYFMPFSISKGRGTYKATDMAGAPTNPLYVSRGAVHGEITSYDWNSDNAAYRSHLYNLYQYGLIKPDGVDSGWNTGLGEYPIYARTGVFSPVKNQEIKNILGGRLVDGYYSYNSEGKGRYYIDPTKYYINTNDENTIYKVDGVSSNSLPGTVAVIDTDGSTLYVSGNDIVSIDSSRLALPKDLDGNQIVEDRTSTQDGNVDFTDVMGVAVPYHLYKGYPENSKFGNIYFSTDNQMQCRNSDWWNEYVMGDLRSYEDAGHDTPYTVKAAQSVTVDDIKNADLIYISGTYETFTTAGSDISEDVLLQIYNDEVNYKHTAVMMDYAVYDSSLGNNISKLAALLWQKSQSSFYTNNQEEHATWFNVGKITDVGKGSTVAKEQSYHNLKKEALADTALWDAAKASMVPDGTGNGNFVTGNTYVYNHHMADFTTPKAMLDALDNFANGDFKTPYTSTVVTQGLNAVSRYIEATNKNSLSEQMSTDITPAVCIQYILVSQGIDLEIMKTSLRVLEIEPVAAFIYNTERGSQEYAELRSDNAAEKRVIDNRNEFVSEYLSAFYTEDSRINYIQFTSMTVNEFNARNEDLVETYDIIYIGDETTRDGSNLYFSDGKERSTFAWNDTDNKYELSKSTSLASYNDANMTGNLYYNVGDKVDVFGNSPGGDTGYGGVSGWLDNNIYGSGDVISARYPARDITKNKLTKLEEFVESNALVLVAEDLMGTTTVANDTQDPATSAAGTQTVKNTQINPTVVVGPNESNDTYGRVDNSSNLYEFLSYALGKEYTVSGNTGDYLSSDTLFTHDNVVAISDIKQGLVDKELLAEYVSTEKLVLNLKDKPTPYTYSAENNGKITNCTYLTTEDPDGTRYLEYNFTIEGANETTSEQGFSVALYVDINKDGKFSDTTEKVQDIVIRTEGDGQEAIKDEANNYVLSSGVEYTLRRNIAEDYSGLLNWKLDIQSNAIPHLHDSETGYTLVKDSSDKKRKIRILQITNGSSTLDMEARLYKGRTTENVTNSWELLLNNVPDYDIYIRTINVREFDSLINTKYDEYAAKIAADNKQLPSDQQVVAMSKSDYVDKAYDTFFKDFVIQNVSIEDCTETPLVHLTGDAQVDGSVLKSKGYENEIGVDMLVCAFGDDYQEFGNSYALDAIQSFIKIGKPVLTSHDFIHFRTGASQNRVLRNLFGADVYGVTQNMVVDKDAITGKNKVSMLNAWNAVSVTGNQGNDEFIKHRTNNGLNYLHSGIGCTRSAEADKLAIIEGTGKEVAYQPNSNRNMTVPETQGLSTMLIEWCRDNRTSTKSWINAVGAMGNGKNAWTTQNQPGLGDNLNYTVEQINEGQITNYPYRLKKSFKTTATHGQYYTLDLTSDLDNDGESDVVVWYALGDSGDNSNQGQNPYSETRGASIDPANGYYIYNDGNVTYTGAGHKNLKNCGLDEVELFINTLIAAYQTGVSNPSVGFYETLDVNDKPITSVIVPYDGNVTNPKNGSGNKFDSSILRKKDSTEYRYKFVDPNTETSKGVTASDGTMIYYRVGDDNFVRGTKNIKVRYYLQVANVITDEEDNKSYYKMPDGTKLDVVSLDVNGTTISAVDISKRIYTYKTSGTIIDDKSMNRNEDGSLNNIESGRAYGFYLPMNLLNDNAGFTILVEAQTTITSVSTSGYGTNTTTDKAYQALSVVKADLLDLD